MLKTFLMNEKKKQNSSYPGFFFFKLELILINDFQWNLIMNNCKTFTSSIL